MLLKERASDSMKMQNVEIISLMGQYGKVLKLLLFVFLFNDPSAHLRL